MTDIAEFADEVFSHLELTPYHDGSLRRASYGDADIVLFPRTGELRIQRATEAQVNNFEQFSFVQNRDAIEVRYFSPVTVSLTRPKAENGVKPAAALTSIVLQINKESKQRSGRIVYSKQLTSEDSLSVAKYFAEYFGN